MDSWTTRARSADGRAGGRLTVGLMGLHALFLGACVQESSEAAAFDPQVTVSVLREIGEEGGQGLVFGLISDVEHGGPEGAI